MAVDDQMMACKECRKCGTVLPATEEYFKKHKAMSDGLLNSCKQCTRAANRAHYHNNKDQWRERTERNRARINAKQREWRWANRDQHLENKRKWSRTKKGVECYKRKLQSEKHKSKGKEWRAKNREKLRAIHRDYYPKWLDAVPGRRLSHDVSVYMARALNGKKGGRSWKTLVGYGIDELMRHIEAQFQPGMTWENYGKYGWHIDHKKPISAFSFSSPEDDEFKQCWALGNLQPLWWRENLSKKNKYQDASR